MTIRLFLMICLGSFLTAQTIVAQTTMPFTSVFGDKIVGERDDNILINFQYDTSQIDVSEEISLGGSISTVNSLAQICTGIVVGANVKMQSLKTLSYLSGHEGAVFFTAAFPNGGVTDSSQWIGLFDDDNGVAVGFNATTFSILQRRNGVDTTVSQANFNGDTLNGSGASGFNLNPAVLNVFRISYGWLGASIINFQIQNTDGSWITFHTIRWPNSSTTPSIFNPALPMTAHISKGLASLLSNLCILTGSWGAAIAAQGPRPNSRIFTFEASDTVGVTSATIFSLRNRTTFQGIPNTIMIKIAAWSLGNNEDSSNQVFLQLIKNGTLLLPIFTDFDTNESVAEIDVTGSYVGNSGQVVLTRHVNFQKNRLVDFLKRPEYLITLGPGEMLTITADNVGGFLDSSIVQVALSWEELF